ADPPARARRGAGAEAVSCNCRRYTYEPRRTAAGPAVTALGARRLQAVGHSCLWCGRERTPSNGPLSRYDRSRLRSASGRRRQRRLLERLLAFVGRGWQVGIAVHDPRAGVPARRGVVVPGGGERLGLLEPVHGGQELVVGGELRAGTAVGEACLGVPLAD